MSQELIITLIALGVPAIGGIIGLVIALIRGDMKKFIVEKMEEAEKQDLTGAKKLEYVVVAVKEKYKIMDLLLNVKKFVEYIISISKQINCK